MRAARVGCLVLTLVVTSCTGAAPRQSSAPATPAPETAVAPTPIDTEPTETEATETEPTDTGSHETPPVPTDTPFIQPTPAPDPFGRHDSPPDGVDDELDYSVPHLFPCGFVNPGPGQWAKAPATLEIPGRIEICILGFRPEQPVEVSISVPDGTTISAQPLPDGKGTATVALIRLPGDPEGTYGVHVQQAELAADTAFEVTPPKAFVQTLAVPETPRAGETITIWFGGLPPGQAAPAYLYRLSSQLKWQFTAVLGDVGVDDRGYGSIELRSESSDPVGEYLVVVPGADVSFKLQP